MQASIATSVSGPITPTTETTSGVFLRLTHEGRAKARAGLEADAANDVYWTLDAGEDVAAPSDGASLETYIPAYAIRSEGLMYIGVTENINGLVFTGGILTDNNFDLETEVADSLDTILANPSAVIDGGTW